MPRRNRRDPGLVGPPPPSRADAPAWAMLPAHEVRQLASEKEYRCPGCDHVIRPGTWHLVVIPHEDLEERRHWHIECWRKELRRVGRGS